MAVTNRTQAGARADRLDAAELTRLMPIVATRLLGEPNRALSTTRELRFGTHGSLSVDLATARWFNHAEGAGGGLLDLIARERKASNGAAVAWLESEGLLDAPKSEPRRSIIAIYEYFDDAGGAVIARKVRHSTAPRFGWQRPDGKGGWIDKLGDVVPGLYRLPELLAAHSDSLIVICEGERDADRAAALGLIAVCGPHGGGKRKWRPEYATDLAGHHIAIIPDNDIPGQEYAADAIASLRDIALSVTVLDLPGLSPKGDFSDWAGGGGTLAQFTKLYAAAEPIDFAAFSGEAGDAEKPSADPDDDPDDGWPEIAPAKAATESGVLEAFGEQFGECFRYEAKGEGWAVWDSCHWCTDERGTILALLRRIARVTGFAAEKPGGMFKMGTAVAV